ncbi:DUF1491 family protein [Paracoccus sp. Z118]|uniref:DUF1491 family protein n=1 Tax=Paracoccus sp. Z118 TaxID=2851017 RepID=UPI001C2C8809|nr:DUF1491 family protein [Paracoccus sp. Z118]MBV0891492.1 DUF1491 family protein [Paracoccus sp. Z118]
MEARLASGIWVAAYFTRLRQANIPAYVLHRGDDTAGAIAVKSARLDGTAQLWLREWDFETDTRSWRPVLDGAERDIDARIARDRAQDRDLWVIEIESRDGATLLDEM